MTDTVLVSVQDGVARITLNAPERLNAVDTTMLDHIADAVERLGSDRDVRVIAITGEGRGFCAGANLSGGAEKVGEEVDTGTLTAVGRAVRAIVGAPTPTVAVVGGVAAGVGVSLALACDYVLASDAASFVLAFSRIGLMPDGGATGLVAASVGRAKAMRMALTGEKVDGRLAEEWGLVAECVAAEELPARADALLARLAASAPETARATSAAINAASLDLEAALAIEERDQARLLASHDFAEGVAAFFERRPARFRGPGDPAAGR